MTRRLTTSVAQLSSRLPAAQVDCDRLGVLLDEASATDDSFTRHSANVAVTAVRIGNTLGLSSATLEVVHVAAWYHDVGKARVPREVLGKCGPLDPSEWRLVRAHPVMGARLLASCRVPQEVVDIVLRHHERWDGCGYPDGEKGEAIPIGARVVAVADAICAMLEPRPYRAALAADAVRAEIADKAGSQFDPRCARAAYRAEYADSARQS
jgi:putative nucleotidyltransferase with HDIG domain